MKKIVLMAIMIATGMSAMAQDEIETTVSGDIVSSYVWRGQDLGSTAIQPSLGVGYKGLSLSAWGSYGLTNPEDAKEFDLTLAYSVGGSIYNYSEFYMAGTYCTNQYRYMLNAWNPYRNPESNFPAGGASGSSMLPSDFMVHDASYLRLKNISLSYLFNFKKAKWIKSLSVGVSADNLYLWTRYNGFDPDVSSKVSDQESTIRRADIGAYPRPRKVVGMVQIIF